MAEQLTLDILKSAVAGTAAAFRCRATLQPAAGEGTKVFPPTYAGAVYATEKRRLPGYKDPVDCVLLDSVQSQANRMEEALQQAIDAGRLKMPLIEVDFTPYFPGENQPPDMRLLDPVGKVTSLQVPHRIADAILRESLLDDIPFRDSDRGQRVGAVNSRDATALFEFCPTALVFGMWDSTGPRGGLGAKFERALVSEIVGINAMFGIRTSSRIDPIIRKNPQLYWTEAGGWTPLESEAVKEGAKQEPKKYSKKLSELNLGNVTPSFGKYTKGAEGADVLQRPALSFDYRLRAENEELSTSQRFVSDWPEAREGAIAPGGVTIERAEQTIVLSLPALRRLRFPVNGAYAKETEDAARTVLAALGICAAALAAEAGLDLRSRCLLWPTEPLSWELLRTPGAKSEQVAVDAENAIKILQQAVEVAKQRRLPWQEPQLRLTPSPRLVRLVVQSQRLALEQGGESAEGSE